METLVNDSHFFSQITTAHRRTRTKPERVGDYVRETTASLLGSNFGFNPPTLVDDSETTGLPVYDALTKILPVRSAQSLFFWRRMGKSFASMLDSAAFPISSQVAFLTFVYARVLGMMGPLEESGPGSFMTFDGSPVELSWVFPSNVNPEDGNTGRQVRFAIEPIDPRSGQLLRGADVLRYLSSRNGGLGLVKCESTALDWSMITQEFLHPRGDQGDAGPVKRFFIGFDFQRSGDIVLKTYYLPSQRDVAIRPKQALSSPSIHIWDVDYAPLRSLISRLDPTVAASLDSMISYVEGADFEHKPRLEILSVDCVPNEANRLKLYGRPMRGASWSDARSAFTLGGRLNSPKMDRVLARLETLWNLLFPFADSHSNRDLDTLPEYHHPPKKRCRRGATDHPSGGLLYYYSLVPGSGMVFPKIYLPVARYCVNDLQIAQALEDFHATNDRGAGERGWVTREVSSAYNHRPLDEKTGIHTYVTFALKKNYEWELTSYFSPEVWESL